MEKANASRTVALRIRLGLHARPAAALAKLARDHTGAVTVACGAKSANAKSVVGLMGLGAGFGAQLTVCADEPGAEAAVAGLVTAIAGGLGDPLVEAAAVPSPAAAPPRPDASLFSASESVVLLGTGAVFGLALGAAVRLARVATAIPQTGAGASLETDRLAHARKALIARLESARGGPTGATIFAAHLALLDEPELNEATAAAIAAGASAERAWTEGLDHLEHSPANLTHIRCERDSWRIPGV